MKNYQVQSTIYWLTGLFIFISFQGLTKESKKDTNIVCFAAQKKWICAPKDNQDIAQEKANKLIEESNQVTQSESSNSNTNVIVQPLAIPKMKAVEPTSHSNSQQTVAMNEKETETVKMNNEVKQTPEQSQEINRPTNTITSKDYSQYWAYQLVGVSSEKSALDFVQSNNLNKNDILIVESVHQGNPWYVVLFNLYTDKSSGLNDKHNLPSQMSNAWLRPLKNLTIVNLIE